MSKLEKLVQPAGKALGDPVLVMVSHNPFKAELTPQLITRAIKLQAPKGARGYVVGQETIISIHTGNYKKPFMDQDSQPESKSHAFCPVQFYK